MGVIPPAPRTRWRSATMNDTMLTLAGVELHGHDVGSGGKPTLLIPAGEHKANGVSFTLDEQAAGEIIAAFERHGADVPIDVEHESLKPGHRAGAVGFIKQLWFEKGRGLSAMISWNAEGQGLIRNKQYQYLSPTVLVRKEDGRAVYLDSAALTLRPAIPRMERVAAARNSNGETNMTTEGKTGRAETPNTDKLVACATREYLGLSADAGADQVMAALKRAAGASTADADIASTVRKALKLPAHATIDAVALAASLHSIGPAMLELVEARRKEADRLVDEKIEKYRLKGTLYPDVAAAARRLAHQDAELFEALFAALPSPFPHQGRLCAPNAEFDARLKVLREAELEYGDRTNKVRGLCSFKGYCEQKLQEANMGPLTAQEIAALKPL